LSRIKRYFSTGVIALAIVGAGAAALPVAAHASTVRAGAAAVAPASGWQREGVYPDADCRERARRLIQQGFLAQCVWHPPILIGYKELQIYVD
jgi:hypothetical protein